MRVVRLEKEWRALGNRSELVPATRLPEVHLRCAPYLEESVPVPVRDSNVCAHIVILPYVVPHACHKRGSTRVTPDHS
jgi:hypothetical protein